MRIILSPETKDTTELRDVYNQAFDVAEELYIASAYLTDWDVSYKIGSACKRVVFLVGTDFGLTRKAAMHNVLRWVPKRISSFFFGAVPQQSGGFHPKIVAWKARTGKHYCIIGSSNLSKAGFSTNYEANIRSEIVSHEFERLRKWIDGVAQSSHPVTSDWIKHHYTEAPLRKGNTAGKHLKPVIRIKPSDLPHGQACEGTVRAHRKKQIAFRQIGEKIRAAARRCSQGRISSSTFWKIFWGLWSDHESRLQGSGLQISGKAADWQEACGSLVRILDARRSSKSTVELDQIVSKEIDLLAKALNPARGAWLSEMLCHYFPDLYPIRNMPVQKWLSMVKLRGRRGATEGQRYIELAQKLRTVVKDHHPAGARDLAELDGGIFQLAHDRGLLKER